MAKNGFVGLMPIGVDIGKDVFHLVDFDKEERWSRKFGPVVAVDRMKKVMIQNEETKEPFA